jgi:hypothetical protein
MPVGLSVDGQCRPSTDSPFPFVPSLSADRETAQREIPDRLKPDLNPFRRTLRPCLPFGRQGPVNISW